MAHRLAARIEDLRERYQRLTPRERRAVGALAAAVALFATFLVGFVFSLQAADLRAQNETLHQALRDLQRLGQPYLENQQQQQALARRIPATPLELNAYVERVASAVGVKIDESKESKPLSGDKYTRRGLEIKLRKIKIEQLTALLQRLTNDTQHLVQVTELSVNTRWGENRELDVELVVSTFERRSGSEPAKAAGKRSRS